MRIKTDWTASPPVTPWRRPIGTGLVLLRGPRQPLLHLRAGRRRGVVTCCKLTTGDRCWAHRDTARFRESNGGASPSATPTISNGRAYTFGATGILNMFSDRDGGVVWSRNAASDTGTKIPLQGLRELPVGQ